jgi:periplasmic copper chaperone A
LPDVTARPALVTAAAAAAALVTLTACGSGSGAAAGTTGAADVLSPAGSSAAAVPTAPVLVTAGHLVVSAGYVPQPASPDVAAAYLTVTNTGDQPDAIVSASSDASTTTTLHRTVGGSMVPLAEFDVPAHGSAAFTPGADHLMLDQPTRPITKGGRVVLTLVFRTAGPVTVTLPVTGYPTGGGIPSDALSPVPQATASAAS